MYSSDPVNETRILIAPDPDVGNGVGHLLSLRHPKSENSTCYLFVDGGLQELQLFKQSYSSWFIGDYVCEDGSLYIATSIDPVFILLPIFAEARMKKLDDPGKFRQLDEIIYVDGYPGYQHLLSVAEKSMQVVCEIKEIGSMKFFRLDDAKVLIWLSYKAQKIKETLFAVDKYYVAQREEDALAAAVSILMEYLKDEPWLKLLCNHLKIKLPGAVATQIVSAETKIGSSNSTKEKRGASKEGARSGRGAKKAKTEADSRNIKDMFSMALRKKS